MKKKLLIAATILLASTLSAFQLRTVDFENFTPGNGAPTAPDDQGFFWYTFENGSFGTDAFSNSVISVGPQQVGAGQALLLGDATEGTFTSGSFYGTGTFSSGPDSDLVDFANSDTPSTTLSMSIIWSPQSGGSDDQSFTFYTYDAVDFDSGTPEINNHSPLRIKNDGSIVLLDPSNNFSEEPLNVSLVADQQYLFYIRHDYSTKLWDAFLISGGEKIDLITQRAFTASGITNSESLITIETSFTAGDNGEGGNDLLIIDNIIAWAVESRPTRANIDLNISYNFDAFVDGANNLFATGAPASFGGFAFGTTSLLHESGYTGIVQGGALDSIGQAGYIGGTEETFANVGTIGGATIFGGYVDQPAFHVFDLNTPVVSFSADLRIEPAAERRSAEKVFVSLFDPLASDDISRGAGYAFLEFASDGNIYFRNGPQNFVTNGTPTGQSYLNNNNYRAVITVDYLRQRWSATLEDLESGGDTVTLVDDEPVDASGWINAYTSANIQLFYSDTENASFPETLVYFDNLEVRPEDTGGDLLSNITLATDYEDYPLGNGPPQDPDGWHPHSAYFFGANATSTADFLNDSVVRVEDREFTQFGEPVTSRVTVIGGESSSLTFIPDGEPDGGFVGIATFPTAPTTADNPAYNFGNSDTPVLDIQIDFAFFPDQESTAFQQWEFFIYDPGPDPENPGFFPHSGVVVNHNGGVAVRDDHSDFMNQVDIDDLTLDDGELYRLIMRIDYENSTWSAWIQDFDGGVTQIADKRSHTASGLTSPTGAMNVQVGSAVDSNGNAASGEVIFDNWIVRAVPSASTDIIQPFSVDFEDFTEGENNIFRRSPALRPFDGWRTSGSPATPYNDGIAGIIEGDDNPINDTKGGFLGGLDDAGNAGDSIGLYSGYLRGSYHNIITNGPITKTMEMDFYFDPVDGATSELTFYKYDGNDPSAVGNTTGTFHSLIIIAADGAISVADSSSSPAVDTGLSIALRTPYRLIMELDYDNLVWSASIQNLDTEAIIVVADERSFSASGWVATRDGVSMIISDDLSAKLYFDNMIIKFNEEAERSNVLASVDFETYTIGDGAASGQAGDPEFELGAFGSPATFPNSVSSIEADPATGDRSLVFGDMTGGTFSSSDFHGIGSFTPEVPSRVIDIANSSTPSVTRTVAFTWSPQLGGSDTQVFWFSVTDPMDLANSASFTLHSAIQIDSDGSLSIVDRLGESDSVSLGVTLSPDVEYTLYIRNDYSSMRWDAFIDSPAEGQIDLVTQRSFEASGLIDPEAVLSVDTAFTAEGDGLVGNDLLIVDNMFSWAVPTHPSRANIDLNVSYDFESFTTGVNELFTGGTTDSFGGFAYGTTTLAPSSGYTGIAESTALDPDGKVAFVGRTAASPTGRISAGSWSTEGIWIHQSFMLSISTPQSCPTLSISESSQRQPADQKKIWSSTCSIRLTLMTSQQHPSSPICDLTKMETSTSETHHQTPTALPGKPISTIITIG